MKTIVFTLIAFCLSKGASAQSADEWPILHNVNHTGFSATTKLKPPLKVKWVTKINSVIQNPGPVVAGGKVAIQDERGYLYCIDAETGALKWKYFVKKTGAYCGTTSPCVWNGRAYASFYVKGWPDLGGMYCFDLNTGKVLWHKTSGYVGPRIKFSPQVSNGKLFYISNVDVNRTTYTVGNYSIKAQVQAWDAVTGDSLWTYTLGDGEHNNTTLLVVEDTVFASAGVNYGNTAGKTAVLDLNGNERWTSTQYHVSGYLGNLQYLPGQLWMLEASGSSAATVLNTSNWSVKFRNGGGDEYSKISALMNGKYWNRHYGAPPDVFDANTGQYLFSAKTINNETFNTGCASPVAANGYVYQGFGSPTPGNPQSTGHKWYAWDETGNPVWSYQVASNSCPSMAIAYDKLYSVTGAEGLVFCFENAQ